MLTTEKVIKFLEDSWQMKDVAEELLNDREKFLNKLMVTIQERVPFQTLFIRNLAFMLPEKQASKWPTLDEIDHACMSGNGGNCTVINLFISRLLQALGLSISVSLAVVTSNVFNSHLVVIVKDLINVGDRHLIDGGLGLPSFQAIPLNFNKESPVYQNSFLEYKFIKHDGKILRMHGKGDLMVRNDPPKELDFIQGKWRRFYEFNIENMMEWQSFAEMIPTLLSRFLRKFDPRAARFPGGKAILLYADILYVEKEDKTLKTIFLKSKEEIFQAFEDYFPSIDKELIKQAYSKWHKSKL
ncbi:uncharacterized protein LOC114528669 [Dendronephthya gigantea]|uniref:uncharacterized protein LOC114528669 n=1 Tax=Dendronephthya gigantea TaxID=151771 RepID=UPI00106C7CD5|nr:uncharacterized protein LOC114528669 [Dendronephthya gigantea]XP_028406146.1 uncharacterized protein LOC114528669 [Dendronephthya gigantea]